MTLRDYFINKDNGKCTIMDRDDYYVMGCRVYDDEEIFTYIPRSSKKLDLLYNRPAHERINTNEE